MPTVAQLESALRAADAKGNAADAVILAGALKRARQEANVAGVGEVAVDVARSVPGGLTRGAASVVDTLSMMVNPAMPGGVPNPTAPSAAINAGVEALTGGYYKPETAGGRYAETIAAFAPTALTPGNALQRASRMVLPGAGAQTAREISDSPYAGAIGALAGGVLSSPSLIRSISQIASGVPRAERILTSTAASGEGGAQAVARRAAEFEQTGEPYSFIDVGGHGVQRVARAAAAGEGAAQDIAVANQRSVAAATPGRAEAAAYRLTPGDTRTTQQATDELTTARSRVAEHDYGPAYKELVRLDQSTLTALGGTHGRAAITRALSAADARLDTSQADELRSLLSGSPPQQVSAGTLHRIEIAMRERATTATVRGARDIGSGLYGRTDAIRGTLEQSPTLGPANAAYRAGSADIDAVELGTQGTRLPDSQYVPQLAALAGISPGARQSAGVGMRQAMVDKIRDRPAGTVGPLNDYARSPAVGANLSATFGVGQAKLYQTQVEQILQRLQNANQNTPTAGSRTAVLEADMKSLAHIPRSGLGLLTAVANWIYTKGVVTPAVRAEIQRLGTSESEVRRLVANIPPNVSPTEHIAALYASSHGVRRTP